jgi:hypothetical protein
MLDLIQRVSSRSTRRHSWSLILPNQVRVVMMIKLVGLFVLAMKILPIMMN